MRCPGAWQLKQSADFINTKPAGSTPPRSTVTLSSTRGPKLSGSSEESPSSASLTLARHWSAWPGVKKSPSAGDYNVTTGWVLPTITGTEAVEVAPPVSVTRSSMT